MGYTSEIRLRQLQHSEWLHDNPLEIWNYNNINSFKSNLIAQVLCIINNLVIALKYSYINSDYFKISPGKIPLIDIFKNDYRKYVKSFRNKELLYLEQFLYISSKALREWNEMRKIYRGKIPKWWHQLLNKVTINGSHLKKEFLIEAETHNNSFPYCAWSFFTKKFFLGFLFGSTSGTPKHYSALKQEENQVFL